MKFNRNLIILFATLVIMMIGFGIIIPILPFYVESMGGSGIAMGLLMAIYSLMQFLFSPVWGGLSDRFGRKPILIVGVFGNAITMILLGLSSSIPMLLTMRGLAGVLSSATLPTAMAFISDSTDEKTAAAGWASSARQWDWAWYSAPAWAAFLPRSHCKHPSTLPAGFRYSLYSPSGSSCPNRSRRKNAATMYASRVPN